VDEGLELLDTPGILWPRFDSQTVGENLAFTGAVRDEVIDRELLCANLMARLRELYPESITNRYKFTPEPEASGLELLEMAARKRGFLISGGEYDLERMAAVLLDEFRGGKLGRISLERPSDFIQ
ncbi:MAG: ribosome biogenesis GTPase YlqF, partial [Clostridiales bacterium]|nr:ribosome biogenesis GTPase YlqF [Clostridiales bacterium]